MLSNDAIPIECPACESTHWKAIAGGNYTAELWIDTAAMETVEEDEIETNRMDTQPWTCTNGHDATDDIAEALEERMP